MEKKNKRCQSCGMPLSKDPQGGGTEKDGSKSLKYCHWCYKDGEFVGGNVSFEEWRAMAIKGMTENGDMSKFMAWLFTRKMFLKNLERWKKQ